MIKKTNVVCINLDPQSIAILQEINYLNHNKKVNKEKNLSGLINTIIASHFSNKAELNEKRLKCRILVMDIERLDAEMKNNELIRAKLTKDINNLRSGL